MPVALLVSEKMSAQEGYGRTDGRTAGRKDGRTTTVRQNNIPLPLAGDKKKRRPNAAKVPHARKPLRPVCVLQKIVRCTYVHRACRTIFLRLLRFFDAGAYMTTCGKGKKSYGALTMIVRAVRSSCDSCVFFTQRARKCTYDRL